MIFCIYLRMVLTTPGPARMPALRTPMGEMIPLPSFKGAAPMMPFPIIPLLRSKGEPATSPGAPISLFSIVTAPGIPTTDPVETAVGTVERSGAPLRASPGARSPAFKSPAFQSPGAASPGASRLEACVAAMAAKKRTTLAIIFQVFFSSW
ncbi:hypothetical protein X975_21683, partial [Stegodyphus mimosarum]